MRFLASVRDAAEAHLALCGGADIIDFKEPEHGALGAVHTDAITAGLRMIAGRATTSATAGDWPLDAQSMTEAVQRVGATGVDYVKLGFLPEPDLAGCLEALAPIAARYRIVALFFADRGVPLEMLPRLSEAGFAGAMIDTFTKDGRGLLHHIDLDTLHTFVTHARAHRLLTGLAGALRCADIPVLAHLGPDVLGFRSAICDAAVRNAGVALERVREVRRSVDAYRLDE